MTTEELESLCAEWQRRLRLVDWHIGVKLGHCYELDHDCLGQCDINAPEKAALIRILDPAEDEPSKWDVVEPYDVERTLVHELLHVLLHGLLPKHPPKDSPQYVALEQTINLLSHAMVNAKRGVEDPRSDQSPSTAQVQDG